MATVPQGSLGLPQLPAAAAGKPPLAKRGKPERSGANRTSPANTHPAPMHPPIGRKADSAVSLATFSSDPLGRTRMRPSQYIHERSLSTADRLAQASFTVHTPTIVELVGDPGVAASRIDFPVDRPLFEPFPPVVVLQAYVPFQAYDIVISFRNNDKEPRHLEIEPIENPIFSISGKRSASLKSGKVAAGMEVEYVLQFKPESEVDYTYNLVCITDREKFLVPISAIGARGLLDFPDSIAFSEVPVRYRTVKTVLVRNIGNRATKFDFSTSSPFAIEPPCGYLDVNGSMQIDVVFSPEETASYEGDLLITYETGEEVVCNLMGTAEDANIRLEKSALRMDNTYISLSSMKSIRIHNRSDIMAKFKWKRYATANEEKRHRLRKSLELAQEEEEEIERRWGELEPSVVVQKYKNLTRTLNNNELLFTDSIFRIEPCEGTIWPNSHIDINVFFTPDTAGTHSRTVYCEAEGREMRLPLQVKGEGIGPRARFSYDMLDMESVSINTVHKYEVLLENRGDIDVSFSLVESKTLFGSKFSFEPTSGVLKIGQQQAIEVSFGSDMLGEFFEEFAWNLKGSPTPLTLSFRGHVVGPTFHFSVPSLNFHKVSYGFLNTDTISLVNTSSIAMTYTLRIPTEHNKLGEFTIDPASATIPPMDSQKITVGFTPKQIMQYNTWLSVDIQSVGEDLQRLVLRGESIVPSILLHTPSRDYGDCFLHHPYYRIVELENSTDYPARYNLLAQEESAKSVYAYSSKSATGIIAPRERKEIPVDIQIKRLGQINFPIFIGVEGNETLPLGVDISATGIGPNVIVSATELNWGKINVLKNVTQTLTIHNASPIPATYTATTVGDLSVFRVEPDSGTIPPGATTDLVITAYLDDCLKFTDILKIAIQNAAAHEVQLVARGQGTTVVFDDALQSVDFRDVFSNRGCEREFTMTNKGRRTQVLHWTVGDEKRFMASKTSDGDTNTNDEPAFEVIPSRFTLKPNASQVILVKGYSERATTCTETLICLGTIEKDPARRTIVEMKVSANFINPLVEMVPPVLRFSLENTSDEAVGMLVQDLTLRNVSSLPLSLSFRCPQPYSVVPSDTSHRLVPNESTTITVRYDPSFNTDRVSTKEHHRLIVSYSEHPQRDVVDLYSEVSFPNLVLGVAKIEFGCIPVWTERKERFWIENRGTLEVGYSWSFIEAGGAATGGNQVTSSDDGSNVHNETPPTPPSHPSFDILPLRGRLAPSQSELVEVTFYGHAPGASHAYALCDVTGGPKYPLLLTGESSSITYTLSSPQLDFGTCLYQDVLEQDLTLQNTGLVSFDFSVILFPNSELAKKICIFPASGTIAPHGKQRIVCRLSPMVPEVVEEEFFIGVAHFEPVRVGVRCVGLFPKIGVTLPRASDSGYEALVESLEGRVGGEGVDVEVEAEAERLLLKAKTMDFLAGVLEDVKAKVAVPGVVKGKFVGSPILFLKNSMRGGGGPAGAASGGPVGGAKERKSHSVSESSAVELARYICDFGNVIRNAHKKRTFKVTNYGAYPVSFTLDKSLLAGTGFTIEPDKVKNLPGLPHCESVEFQVSFQARSLSGDLGPTEIRLPVHIAGGPTTSLTLRADVTVPSLVLSSGDVDFGEVCCGLRKTITVSMWNSNAVPCEWSTAQGQGAATEKAVAGGSGAPGAKNKKKRPGSGPVLRDFEVVPASGVLQPNEKTFISIRFTPLEEKDYDELLPIKIAMNPKPHTLHLFGRGAKLSVVFEPDALNLGPILPASDGIEKRFVAYNPSNYPIEMFSVEFDQQYLEEEDMLRRCGGYENGTVFMPPREPGAPLPDFVVEAALAQKAREAKGGRETTTAEGRGGGTRGEGGEGGVGELVEPGLVISPSKGGKTAFTAQPAPSFGPGAALHHEMSVVASPILETMTQQQQQQGPEYPANVILHGPPFSGRTTQAKAVAKKFGQVYIRVDDVIEASPGFDTLKEGGGGAGGAGTTNEKGGMPRAAHSHASSHVGGLSTADGEEAGGMSPTRGAATEEQDPVQAEHYDTFDQHGPLPEDMIVDILKARFHKDDCIRLGVVIDGLESKYCVNTLSVAKVVLRSLSEASGRQRRTLFFHLIVDPSHIREREVAAVRAAGEKEADALQVKEISEEEYDRMTESERAQYDNQVLKAKKKLKELQERKKAERKHWEEEIAARLGDRKSEDEKKGKKAGGRTRAPTLQRDIGKMDKTAPSPGSKSDVKLYKGALSDTKTGAMSPKFSKPIGKEKYEKGEGRGGDKGDKDYDDMSSRFTLTEGTDAFLSDSTHRRYEAYVASVDGVLALAKEEGKPVQRQVSVMVTPDKKPAKGKVGSVAGASYDVGASTMTLESVGKEGGSGGHASGGEESGAVTVCDVNGSTDEQTVFKGISDHIPTPPPTDEGKDMFDFTPPPFVEHIMHYPPERAEPGPRSRYFTLLPPVPGVDNEEEVPSSAEGPPGTAASLGPPPSTAASANGTLTKGETRKSRQPIKIVEDAKASMEPDEDVEKEELRRYRWIIQPHERKELVIKFTSNDVGKFEQELNFELVGVRGRYTVRCVGHCQYSQIVSDPKKVFPRWRKGKEEKTIVHGEFVASTGTFEFGPLLWNKPREKYMEKFPENKGAMNIINPGTQEIKVNISMKNDVKGDVFFFEPSTMDIPAGQTQTLSIWAYPRNHNHCEDAVVVCVKDNPEPYLFKISCIGVKPEVEIDKKVLIFDKMLLGRSEKREIRVKNNSLLPVAWRLAGVDNTGDEFQISPTDGIIDSLGECTITGVYKSSKPSVFKRTIKMEISDADRIGGGGMQDIPIMINAEAYDIATDLHFAKGSEGLDFGVIKVFEEGRQSCTLKNKGKYEVGYRFIFENKDLAELFTISPQQGILQPSDKPFVVQFVLRTSREMQIRDNASCRCQFYEPTTGEMTATSAVKLSARAVFSKFTILPVRDLNFGALIHGTKATRFFTIDNTGEFDFKYSVYKMLAGTTDSKFGSKLRTNSRASRTGRSSSPPGSKVADKKIQTKPGDAMNFGAFTIYPTSGSVQAGSKQQITVEFHPETPGSFEEIAAVDISDRNPMDNADPMEYRLAGESCIPGINTSDFPSIFEEQTVVKRLDMFQTPNNVYADEDRVFHFGAYLAGHQAQARFKISNPYKIPCDVTLTTRPRSKTKVDAADFAFDLDLKKLSIPSHEHRYVTAYFHPTAIQSYAGIFEAVVENVGEGKSKTLMFELRGEGTLPRVTVEKPTARTKNAMPLLKFKRLLVGSAQMLPVVLKNEGIITAEVKLEWNFKDTDDFDCSFLNTSAVLKPQETKIVEVRCRASSVRRMEAELRLRVTDNSFEDTSIIVHGEGYLSDITFDGLPEDSESEIHFGDCFINEARHVDFFVTNHSDDYLRISFGEHFDFAFSPLACHLKPNGKVSVSASFLPKQPTELRAVNIPVRVVKIKYPQHAPETDWDDRMRAVKWVVDVKGTAPRKVVEAVQEPTQEVLGPSANDHNLSMTAFADYSSFESEVSNITFKNTLMFQTRVFNFSIRNSGKVLLRYQFAMYDIDNNQIDLDDDSCPFTVTPASGTIEADDILLVSLRFSPTDVATYQYTLVAHMPNLATGQRPLQIRLRGSSLRPFCHFELPDSDYLTSERRSPESGVNNGIPGVLEASTRVIEFGSRGVKVKNTKRFYLLNPTNIDYNFDWVAQVNDDRVFRCLTPKGLVMSGKKFEMVMEFVPENVDVKEALWRFNIPGHGISIPFLFVGQALEPNVFMDRVGVNFKPILVGRQVKDTVRLTNNEDIPFSFTFNETSSELRNDGTPVLRFSPTSGTIGAKSEVPIEIIFAPSAEKVFNFNLVCNVKKKPAPVTINVKGEGYEVHEDLQTEATDGTPYALAAGLNAENAVDFGLVQINERRVKRVTIINSGKFNFEYAWKFVNKNGGALSVTPDSGTVAKGERVVCAIAFMPTSVATLKNVKAICQILNGRGYPLTITGGGTKPLLKFSKYSHNFGPQFIHRTGQPAATTTIQITNEDVKDISYDVIYPESSIFDVPRGPNTLAAGESTSLEITFYPREAKAYADNIKVEINGLSSIDLAVSGEGTEFRVDLVNPEHRNLNFGAVRVGHTVARSVKIINRSAVPATFQLGTASSVENLANHAVTMSHSGECALRPKGVLNVEFKFQPNHRIPSFVEEVTLEAQGVSKPLFIVMGACQGIDVKLENDTLPFGAVVQKSTSTRRIQLQNVGDIGAKFHWDVTKFAPDFSISPPEGYISPGMDISLEVVFHPTEVNPDIRYENLICNVEGTQPLYLTLTGMCISPQLSNETIKFAAPVRQTDTKPISLSNKTNIPWHIRPIIENDYWTGPDTLDIDPGQTKSYDVTFRPLEMTGDGDGGRHEGSIFFPLPDGTGHLYKLYGTADKPNPIATITREVPCKTTYTELLTLQNWLKRPQRFKVTTELTKPDPSVIIRGHDFVDVPPQLEKEYKLTFYAYKEGLTNVKVTFKNEQTQEYCYYLVNFKSTAPGIMQTIEMSTVVRQVCVREVGIFNPLGVPAVFAVTYNHPDVTLPHSFTVAPKAEQSLPIEFLPLQPRETTTRISLTSPELGLYQYDLRLISTAAGPERSLHFKVGLGGSVTQIFRFLSYAKQKTEYAVRVDHADFVVEKSVSVGSGGVEVTVDVTYEPSKIGDTRTQLVVSSPTGGDYICPLYGHCIAPRPQGPITVKPGTSTSLPFKNVFGNTATFHFVVDNPAFQVKAAETIGAKKTVAISIGYKSTPGTPGTDSARDDALTASGTVADKGGTTGSRRERERERAEREREREREKAEREKERDRTTASTAVLPSLAKANQAQQSKVGKLTVTHASSNVVWIYYLKLGS
ncbi:hypothetical protein HDV00_002527 [Rhizophlyctis rosea]|nr:hypothetical protein HDV00_002527 [Rhizophlyctis rosea]